MAMRRLGAVMAVVAAFAVAVGLAWWRTSDGAAPPGQPVASVAGAVLERGEVTGAVADRLHRAVREVRAEGCGEERQATVTLVRDGGSAIALTNQHVVAGSAEVAPDGQEGIARVLGRVDGRDAVQLDTGAFEGAGVDALASGPRPGVGDEVVVAGYPAGEYAAVAGHVTGIERRQGYGGSAEVLLIDVEAIPGISGGVVVDTSGRAVALVAARDPSTHDVVAYPLGTIGAATDESTTPCP